MAIAVIFTPPSMNAKTYDEVIRKLEAAGAGKPKGRLHHFCYGSGDRLRVFDMWESAESFEAFGKTLQPILSEIGFDPGTPAISGIHNTIPG